MNPMHCDTGRSVGLHLFQELSTLGQQLAHTLLFRQGFKGICPAGLEEKIRHKVGFVSYCPPTNVLKSSNFLALFRKKA
jgi:hypothetical protein